MIAGFDVKDVALGTGDTLTYPFDFAINDLTDLRVMVQDGSGKLIQDVRGNDTTYLASVSFTAGEEGTGQVTLQADLPDTYVMTMLLDILDPQQPNVFSALFTLDLSMLESAFDFLCLGIQSAAARAQRSVMLHFLDDLDSFDPTLPLGLPAIPGGIISVKQDGSGFECVANTSTIGSGNTAPVAYGTQSSPLGLSTSGVTYHNNLREIQFVQGASGPVTIPQVPNGTVVGQEITLVGENASNTVTLSNGFVLGLNNVWRGMWDGANWIELFRK